MEFKLSPEASANGTSLQDYLEVAPAKVIRAFGPSMATDEYKVSGEWVFESDQGHVFTLYDYKATSQYDGEPPTPAEFWASEAPYSLHVGGRNDDEALADFIDWLKDQLR